MNTHRSSLDGPPTRNVRNHVGSPAQTGSPKQSPIRLGKGWVRTSRITPIPVTFVTDPDTIFPDPEAKKLFPYGKGAGDFTD